MTSYSFLSVLNMNPSYTDPPLPLVKEEKSLNTGRNPQPQG